MPTNETKHTPGAWRVGLNLGSPCVLDSSGVSLAEIRTLNMVPEAIANARLIAAAPDLLGVAQAAYEAINRRGGPQMGVHGADKSLLADLEAAIARATGKGE